MALVDQVQAALAGLASPTQVSQQLAVQDADNSFQCQMAGLDTLACAFTEFELTIGKLSSAPIEQLKRVAEALSARLTYLLEPIHPIEVDRDQCVVQMRSSPPQKDDNGTSYYELLVARGGRLSLIRYSRPVGQTERQAVPAQVTREVFLRLVRDFAAVA
jgi:hypothetical protein